MPSPAYRAFVEAFREPLVGPSDDLETAQRKLEAIHGHPIDATTRVEWTRYGGVRCAWVDVTGCPPGAPALLLCHGGAWVAAGGDGYLFYAEMLARACAVRVLLVDYRLAPAHTHPAAVEDRVAVYRGLLRSGADAERVAFIGDSCGGGLAILSMIGLRELGIPQPACAVALGGWFDLTAGGATSSDGPPEPFAHPAFIRARARDYAGPGVDLARPDLSPIHADLSGLPPLLLQVGSIDLTRQDALTLAERAGAHDVFVQLEIVPGMVHGFQGLARAGIPEAQTALERVGQFVAGHIA